MAEFETMLPLVLCPRLAAGGTTDASTTHRHRHSIFSRDLFFFSLSLSLSPSVLPQPLEHLKGHVVAQGVRRDDQVRLVLLEALPEAPVAGQVRHHLRPPPA